MKCFTEYARFKWPLFCIVCLLLTICSNDEKAYAKEALHPTNRKLVMLGMMNEPKYFPNIPRLPVTVAKSYYDANKATFVLISHSSKDLIVGGRHLTEDIPPVIDPNKLLLRKDHILAVYCP